VFLHFFYLTNQRAYPSLFGLNGYIQEKGLPILCGTVGILSLAYISTAGTCPRAYCKQRRILGDFNW